MKKKLLVAALLACSVPVVANAAWQFNTWARNPGGTIDSRNKAGQTVLNSSIFRSYTTHASLPVTVTAGAGYTIAAITVNGINLGPQASPYVASILGGASARTSQSLYASFARSGLAVSATAVGNGTVSPTSLKNVYYGLTSSDIVFRVTPNDGGTITSITGVDASFIAPADSDGVVTVTIPKGTPLTSAVNLVANFSAAPPITVPIYSPPLIEAAKLACINCHTGATVGGKFGNMTTAQIVLRNWAASTNFDADLCVKCHNGADTGAHPGSIGGPAAGHNAAGNACVTCHSDANTVATGDAHKTSAGGCISCHSVGQNAGAGFVQDNTGVRAITGEFGKWSHHVTGVTLQNAHCAACHLEGKVEGGKIVVDTDHHMKDATTHLRNADTNALIVWDPAAPSHSNMDNFCLSCHDANGAAGISAIQALMVPAAGKTASATNPFGDTISNQYDLMERPAVVDAAGQFATGNNSHHAVLGKKYTGRTRAAVAGPRTVDTVAFASNSSAAMPGKRTTIYDAGKFNSTYVTLADAAGEVDSPQALTGRNGGTTLGDDSTLHCGDCHTVGQFRAADVDPAAGSFNKAVIGAHGSNNEYLLRNNAGTDARHRGVESTSYSSGIVAGGPYLVCFNCHAVGTYGYPAGVTGATLDANGKGNHAGEYAYRDRCNSSFTSTGATTDAGPIASGIFANMTGEGRLRTIVATSGANLGKAYSPTSAFFGNIYGIQCANCHNSGVKGNIFGGIHGSATQTYEDGMGNTTKHNRFMPGLGNAMFVPGVKGGFTGGTAKVYAAYSSNRKTGNLLSYTQLPVRTIRVTGVDNANGSYEYISGGQSNDLNWEQLTQQSIAGQTDLQSKAMGCYTVTPNPTVKRTPTDPTWAAAVTGGANYQSAGVAGRTYPLTPGVVRAAIANPAGEQSSPKVAFLAADGYPADDVRYSASYELMAGDGKEVMDVWGGCDDHNGAQGAGTSIYRKALRKTSY